MSQEAGFSERSVNCIRMMLSMSEGNLAQTVNIGRYPLLGLEGEGGREGGTEVGRERT